MIYRDNQLDTDDALPGLVESDDEDDASVNVIATETLHDSAHDSDHASNASNFADMASADATPDSASDDAAGKIATSFCQPELCRKPDKVPACCVMAQPLQCRAYAEWTHARWSDQQEDLQLAACKGLGLRQGCKLRRPAQHAMRITGLPAPHG